MTLWTALLLLVGGASAFAPAELRVRFLIAGPRKAAENEEEVSVSSVHFPGLQDLFVDEELDIDTMLEGAVESDPQLQRVMDSVQDLFAEESVFNEREAARLDVSGRELTEEQKLAYGIVEAADDEEYDIVDVEQVEAQLDALQSACRAEVDLIAPDGLGILPSHKLITETLPDGSPAMLVAKDLAFVDEVNCIGCGLCAQISPSTFMMEEHTGKARVFMQGGDARKVVDEAMVSCPTRCIHHLSWEELKPLEIMRDEDTLRGRNWPGAKGRPEKGSRTGVVPAHCYGTHKCPSAGCYNCPTFMWIGHGANPAYITRAEEQARLRIAWREQERTNEAHPEGGPRTLEL